MTRFRHSVAIGRVKLGTTHIFTPQRTVSVVSVAPGILTVLSPRAGRPHGLGIKDSRRGVYSAPGTFGITVSSQRMASW